MPEQGMSDWRIAEKAPVSNMTANIPVCWHWRAVAQRAGHRGAVRPDCPEAVTVQAHQVHQDDGRVAPCLS